MSDPERIAIVCFIVGMIGGVWRFFKALPRIDDTNPGSGNPK